MVKNIIKKDGQKEPFDPEKIKEAIQKAAEEAGLSFEKINEITEKTSSRVNEIIDDIDGDISSSQIREEVLAFLDDTEKAVADAWRGYDKQFKS
jgi:transcriptional regulator NrdR family protein